MSVEKLLTQNFRNLKDLNIELDSNLNLVVGNNGSGKSSLLEALFFLGHGKSFRTNKTIDIVSYDKSPLVVSVKNDKGSQLGLKRDFVLNETEIKVNGEKQSKLSIFAKNMAVQIVTPESFKLFFGGPKERRRFLDLGLFHVKHSFSEEWRNFSKVLKQRNACLKQKSSTDTLHYWTELFCNHSIVVSESRESYVNQLKEEISSWLDLLLPNICNELKIVYSRGWSNTKDLEEVLQQNKEREVAFGHSLYGAHKFDIKFVVNGNHIEVSLSRGQQKLFLLALTLAQAKLIEKVNRVKPILLIDDIGAELDINSRKLLSEAVNRLNCQVVITAIDKNALEPLIHNNKNYKMFHVEHGEILEMSEYKKI